MFANGFHALIESCGLFSIIASDVVLLCICFHVSGHRGSFQLEFDTIINIVMIVGIDLIYIWDGFDATKSWPFLPQQHIEILSIFCSCSS